MPPSVRFLGRKVYFAIAILLCPANALLLPGFALQEFREEVGVATRTLTRWRRFWTWLFRETPFAIAARAAFMPPLDEGSLPASFLERFLGQDPEERLIKALEFLSEGRGPEPAF